MNKKIAVTGMLLWCLYAPVAHSADATFTVGGKRITCTVSQIKKDIFGQWTAFHLKYEFCDGNFLAVTCYAYATNSNAGCTNTSNAPYRQECAGSFYVFEAGQSFTLYPGTQGAQNYVCEKDFKSRNVTVTPLK
jgi:hypothetical protein